MPARDCGSDGGFLPHYAPNDKQLGRAMPCGRRSSGLRRPLGAQRSNQEASIKLAGEGCGLRIDSWWHEPVQDRRWQQKPIRATGANSPGLLHRLRSSREASQIFLDLSYPMIAAGHLRPLMLRGPRSAAVWTADTKQVRELRIQSPEFPPEGSQTFGKCDDGTDLVAGGNPRSNGSCCPCPAADTFRTAKTPHRGSTSGAATDRANTTHTAATRRTVPRQRPAYTPPRLNAPGYSPRGRLVGPFP